MRVLHLDCGNEMRGGQWQVLHLIEGLQLRGIAATLLCSSLSPLIRRVPGALPFSISRLRSLWRDFDIIHAHDARSHSFAALLGVKPLLVSRRVSFPVGSGFVSRWKYRQPQQFIAISNTVSQSLLAAGIPQEKITVIYDGVQELNYQSDLTGEMIAPASNDPQKGNDLLQAATFPIRFSNDLETDLRTASGFFYISRQEGLGSAILLAMAAKVPVVASKVGGIPELVQHEQSGLLVDNQPSHIKAAFLRLKSEPKLAQTMAENAFARFQQRFTATIMVDKTIDIYKEQL